MNAIFIKSKSHTISTYHQRKVALTAFDTNRWICDDNIHTLAHGHLKTYGVKNEEATNEINWCESDTKNEWDSDMFIVSRGSPAPP